MKRFLLTMLFLSSVAGFSQKINKKELIGTWDLVEMTVEGSHFNIREGKVTPSDAVVQEIGVSREEVARLLAERLKDGLTGNYVVFENDKKIRHKILADEELDDYFLEEKNGKNLLTVGQHQYLIALKDARLYVYEEGYDGEMIFEKQ